MFSILFKMLIKKLLKTVKNCLCTLHFHHDIHSIKKLQSASNDNDSHVQILSAGVSTCNVPLQWNVNFCYYFLKIKQTAAFFPRFSLLQALFLALSSSFRYPASHYEMNSLLFILLHDKKGEKRREWKVLPLLSIGTWQNSLHGEKKKNGEQSLIVFNANI